MSVLIYRFSDAICLLKALYSSRNTHTRTFKISSFNMTKGNISSGDQQRLSLMHRSPKVLKNEEHNELGINGGGG